MTVNITRLLAAALVAAAAFAQAPSIKLFCPNAYACCKASMWTLCLKCATHRRERAASYRWGRRHHVQLQRAHRRRVRL